MSSRPLVSRRWGPGARGRVTLLQHRPGEEADVPLLPQLTRDSRTSRVMREPRQRGEWVAGRPCCCCCCCYLLLLATMALSPYPAHTQQTTVAPGTTADAVAPGTTSADAVAPGTTTADAVAPGTTTADAVAPGTTTADAVVPGTTTADADLGQPARISTHGSGAVTSKAIPAVEGVDLRKTGDVVRVKWNKPSHEGDEIERYKVDVMCHRNHQACGCEECQSYNYTTGDLKLKFAVEPDTKYSVRVAAITTDKTLGPYSLPANLTTQPQVPHVPEVRVKKDKRLVSLKWNYTCPYTGPARYNLSFHDKPFESFSSDGCHYTAKVNDLTPYTEYNFSLLAKREDCNMGKCSSDEEGLNPHVEQCGVCYKNTTSTLPDVPSAPRSLEVTGPDFQDDSRGSRTANVTWQPPELANGLLRSYRLEYRSNGWTREICEIPDDNCPTSTRTQCECNLLSCSIQLRPETEYEFQVRAENCEPRGLSQAAVFKLTTTAGVPDFTGYPIVKNVEETPYPLQTTHPIVILPRTFDSHNGRIRKYEIFVGKNCTKPAGDLVNQIPVFVNNHTSDDRDVPFVIGEDRRPCTMTACNPPLTPDTEYCYTIRIHTSAYYKDYQKSFKTEPSTTLTTVLTVLAVIVGLIILVMVLAGLYVQYFSTMKRSVSMELPLVVPTPPDINVERRILLSDLSSHVSKLLSQRNQGLRMEFLQLKSVCPEKPSRAANLRSNRPKNRYVNILPFDETRVKMREYRSIPCSDYINASYIHGYNQSRRFIACQGPTDLHVEDFWRMVWEKNVHVIVMVTQRVENNKMKCSKYWPDQKQPHGLQMKHARLKVELLHETELQPEGYIVRRLRLSKGITSRSVMHFHFVSWPDMGCPQSPDDLISFVQAVKKAVPPASSHVVVHCSAGVGRTGTFIGLSNLMEEIAMEESVDVFHAVYRMRLHRTNMVQTEAQYAFLYKCVLKYYMNRTGQSEASFMEEDEAD